jgi:hypothetical protein
MNSSSASEGRCGGRGFEVASRVSQRRWVRGAGRGAFPFDLPTPYFGASSGASRLGYTRQKLTTPDSVYCQACAWILAFGGC